MKIGPRMPNFRKSFKARTTGKLKRSIKRSINPFYGKKGMGFVKNPAKSVKNKIYRKTTFSASSSKFWLHIILLFTTCGIGNIIYLLLSNGSTRKK